MNDCLSVWLDVLTLDQQVAGGADGSRLAGGGAGEASAVFGEGLADYQPGEPAHVADLEVDGALNLVVLSEPHYGRLRMTADLTFQGHRLALCHVCVLQTLHTKQRLGEVIFPKGHEYI